MKKITLIRHPKTEAPKGVCYGFTDVAADKEHLDDMQKLIPQRITPNTAIYSSPLKRCALLAEKVSVSSQKIHFDKRLKELNFGNWELQKWNEIPTEEFQEWESDFVNHKVPGGEAYIDQYNRVTEFWNELIQSKEEEIAVFTHSGSIRCILSYILEIPLRKTFYLQLGYGAIVNIKYHGEFYQVEFASTGMKEN